jgi:hypothetical protein
MKFSEELSLEEMQELAEIISENEVEDKIKEQIAKTGIVPLEQERETMKQVMKEEFLKQPNRQFFEAIKGELEDIPVDVMVNIKAKQRNMAQNADKITNILREVIRNPQAFSQIPGVAKAFNQVLEESGLSPIDFSQITKAQAQPTQPEQTTEQPVEQAQL